MASSTCIVLSCRTVAEEVVPSCCLFTVCFPDPVRQPVLQARRDVALGIADRIQKLATEISGYNFPRGSPARDSRAEIEAEVDRRIAEAKPTQPPIASGFSAAVAADRASKGTPPRSTAGKPASAAKPSPIRAPLSTKPTDASFDHDLDAEIREYMRNSPVDPSSGNEFVIDGRVPAPGAKVMLAAEASTAGGGKKLDPTAVAAAREKLAGKTAALRRKSIAEKVAAAVD